MFSSVGFICNKVYVFYKQVFSVMVWVGVTIRVGSGSGTIYILLIRACCL